ncbi:MAG: hypothetical protein ACK55I_34595, partial [bacterium]
LLDLEHRHVCNRSVVETLAMLRGHLLLELIVLLCDAISIPTILHWHVHALLVVTPLGVSQGENLTRVLMEDDFDSRLLSVAVYVKIQKNASQFNLRGVDRNSIRKLLNLGFHLVVRDGDADVVTVQPVSYT